MTIKPRLSITIGCVELEWKFRSNTKVKFFGFIWTYYFKYIPQRSCQTPVLCATKIFVCSLLYTVKLHKHAIIRLRPDWQFPNVDQALPVQMDTKSLFSFIFLFLQTSYPFIVAIYFFVDNNKERQKKKRWFATFIEHKMRNYIINTNKETRSTKADYCYFFFKKDPSLFYQIL